MQAQSAVLTLSASVTGGGGAAGAGVGAVTGAFVSDTVVVGVVLVVVGTAGAVAGMAKPANAVWDNLVV
jgi:hypothetical protein